MPGITLGPDPDLACPALKRGMVPIDLIDCRGDTVLFTGAVSNYDLSESQVDVLHVIPNTQNVTALSGGGRSIPSTSTEYLILFYTVTMYTAQPIVIENYRNEQLKPTSSSFTKLQCIPTTYYTTTVNQPFSSTLPLVRTKVSALPLVRYFIKGIFTY